MPFLQTLRGRTKIFVGSGPRRFPAGTPQFSDSSMRESAYDFRYVREIGEPHGPVSYFSTIVPFCISITCKYSPPYHLV